MKAHHDVIKTNFYQFIGHHVVLFASDERLILALGSESIVSEIPWVCVYVNKPR